MTDIAMKASSCHLPPSLSPLPARGEWKRGRGINPRNPLAKISIVRFRSKWRERERGDGFADFSFLSGCSYGSSYPAATHRSSLSPVARSTKRTKERGAEGEASRIPSSVIHHPTCITGLTYGATVRASSLIRATQFTLDRSPYSLPRENEYRVPSLFFEQERSERKKRLPNTMRIYIYISSRNEERLNRERERERGFFMQRWNRGEERRIGGGIRGRSVAERGRFDRLME